MENIGGPRTEPRGCNRVEGGVTDLTEYDLFRMYELSHLRELSLMLIVSQVSK